MNISKLATRQLSDYDAREPGLMFAEGLSLSVDEAYDVQSQVSSLRVQRGEKIIGYKVGCTSPAIQSQLGIDHCITGRLYDSEYHESGATIQRSQFANLAIEGELAVELSREPHPNDFPKGEIPVCVSRVFPVIELHHFVMLGDKPSAGELIANNAIHGGIVAGEGLPSESIQSAKLETSLSIFQNGKLLEGCNGLELIKTISTSLQWLAKVLRERGTGLKAGQIILTGSVPSLIPVNIDCQLRIDAPPFGSVAAQIAA